MSLLMPLLGLLVTLAALAGLLALGVRRLRARGELISGGVPLQAVIISVRPSSVDTTWAYHPTVRYQFQGRSWVSEPKDGHLRVNPPGWKTAHTGNQFIGQPLDIVVDPQQPTRSAVPIRDRRALTLVTLTLVFGGLIILIGLVGIIAGIILQQ
ncbi:DUF3592 domain-containing protein [Nesterenkonia aerolata]|uniref:DUF3592 domain-containing protein n=1 Tax=Nesterenkonia aerolata TaxID=3074079 RepID=A0ABU2DSJ0_9MICC|nr:DUF3592 domain-containing protein [Nesterenkonia sp. LY-0111]MDR8019346.1 DUF3592 domain-containing protein [Nesterenkonia sp. LY-0111]